MFQGIFKYIGNVVSGRFAHWNTSNNDVVNDLWERSNGFPDPVRIAFHQFISSSSLLMDFLLGPDKGRERLIKKDPLHISRQQFARMHAVILECLAGMFIQVNPSFSESFKGALTILTGGNPDRSPIIQLIETTEKPDVMAVGSAAWKEIVSIAESQQGTMVLDAYPFAASLGSVAIDSFKQINASLRATS